MIVFLAHFDPILANSGPVQTGKIQSLIKLRERLMSCHVNCLFVVFMLLYSDSLKYKITTHFLCVYATTSSNIIEISARYRTLFWQAGTIINYTELGQHTQPTITTKQSINGLPGSTYRYANTVLQNIIDNSVTK